MPLVKPSSICYIITRKDDSNVQVIIQMKLITESRIKNRNKTYSQSCLEDNVIGSVNCTERKAVIKLQSCRKTEVAKMMLDNKNSQK